MRIKVVNYGDLSKLGKMYNVSVRSVHNALTYQVNSKRAERIRKSALNMGAVKIDK